MIKKQKRKNTNELFLFLFPHCLQRKSQTLILDCVSETVQDMMVSEAMLSQSTWLLEVLKISITVVLDKNALT